MACGAKYDSKTSKKLDAGIIDSATDRSCSADGYFIDRLAVCSVFSKAAQLLLNRLGIECAYVTGRSEGGSHSWNMVKLDGQYYYVDTTWANTRSQGMTSITYDFFCLTTNELSYDHTIDVSSGLPLCNATAMNYYVRNGLVAANCSDEELARLIMKSLKIEGGALASIKFPTSEMFEEAYSKLFAEGGIFSVLNETEGLEYTSVSYSSDPGRLTIAIYLHGMSAY